MPPSEPNRSEPLPLLEETKVAAEVEGTASPGDPKFRAHGKHRRLEWLIPALLCAIMLGQLLLTSAQLSQTADEATHLYSGYRYLKCGDLTLSPEHPPFAKVIAAAPLLSMNVAVDCAPSNSDALQQAFASLNWLYSQNWPVALTRARAAASIFAIGLCLLVWITARRMFDFATAIMATVLLIFEPNVLAYGSLVLTDIPIACMMLLAVLGFYLWLKHRTVLFLLLTGAATGLALLTKHSGVIALPVLGALAISDALIASDDRRPRWQLAARNVKAVVLVCVIAVGIVWMGYGLRFTPSIAAEFQTPLAPATPRLLLALDKYDLLPQAYLRGFGWALEVSRRTSVAFIAGRVYPQAPWYSTPLNFLIRSTPAMLVSSVVAVFGIAIAFRRRRRELGFLLVAAVVYLAACLHSSNNVSVRYLLPIFPFLLIVVAAGCVELAKRARWLKYAIVCLLLMHAASSLDSNPNYLSYANELWGGPAQAYKYVPWLDLGQAYPQAKTYLERHPSENCWFITAWQWDPQLYDVPCQTFGFYLPHTMPAHVRGTVIVSSTLLTDVRLAEQALVTPFRNSTPKDGIGGSALLVYEGDFDTTADAAASESGLAMRELSQGNAAAALEHGEKAAALQPASPLVHANLCFLLARSEIVAALRECDLARNLLLADPLREEPTRKERLESLENSIAALKTNYRLVYGREPGQAEPIIPVR